MRFIKASECVPDSWINKAVRFIHTKAIICAPEIFIASTKDLIDKIEWLDESLPADDMPAAFHKEPVTFLLSNALRHLTQDQQRQLCNALLERLPVPASIMDAAERLYPDDPDDGFRAQQEIYRLRNAHITAARQYMDTIEKLRDKIVSLEEELALYRIEK